MASLKMNGSELKTVRHPRCRGSWTEQYFLYTEASPIHVFQAGTKVHRVAERNQEDNIIGYFVCVFEELPRQAPRGVINCPIDMLMEVEEVRSVSNLQSSDILYSVTSKCPSKRASALAGFKDGSGYLRKEVADDAIRKFIRGKEATPCVAVVKDPPRLSVPKTLRARNDGQPIG
jgi:hypothetical protein